ncbi:MAG TPA: zf-HC2 domain-containing protein, partial [Candidatus Binatia bacterium]|nr:zf-HC2 domain-containing protein [Candidatus Binatia bacterium]
MTHARVEEMLGLYALGTLDADDVAAVDAHLARCALCAGELASLERTVATLAHAPAPLAPSPETSRRILALPASAPRLRMIPPRAAPPRRRRLLSLLTRGAVAAVLALLVVSNLELVRRLDRARRLQ